MTEEQRKKLEALQQKKETPEERECRRAVIAVLDAYLETAEYNDNLMAQYDKLCSLEAPKSRQLARIKELEEVEIPAGIEKEKRGAGIFQTLMSFLQGTPSWLRHRQALELKYLCGFEWIDIARELYGEMPDFEIKKAKYYDRAMHLRHASILHIVREIGVEKVYEIINQ